MDADDETAYLRARVTELKHRVKIANDDAEERLYAYTPAVEAIDHAVNVLMGSAEEIRRVWGHVIWRNDREATGRNGWWFMLGWNLGIASVCTAARRAATSLSIERT